MSSLLGKLKPEIKARWRAALESKKYPQCTGRLRSGAGFCCLGVLGDLAVEDGVASWDGWSLTVKATAQAELNSFPGSLLKWAFEVEPGFPIDTNNFHYSTDLEQECLTKINDSGLTFPEISKLIEQHF